MHIILIQSNYNTMECLSKKTVDNISSIKLLSVILLGGLFILLGIVTSCSDASNTDQDIAGDEVLVNFQLNTPYAFNQTRSIGENSEETIHSVDILAFKILDNKEVFDYHVKGNKDKNGYKAVLKIKSYEQRFVLVTNAASETLNLVNEHSTEGMEREEMLQNLVVSINDGDKWNTTNDRDYKPLPMYGESDIITINKHTSFIGTIDVTRMVSRINVELDAKLAEGNSFKIRSIPYITQIPQGV